MGLTLGYVITSAVTENDIQQQVIRKLPTNSYILLFMKNVPISIGTSYNYCILTYPKFIKIMTSVW